MHNRISPTIPPPIPQLPGAAAPQSADATSFQEFLTDSIGEVNAMQQDADKAVETLVTGGDVTPAEVLTAVQKADMAFRVMMQMRNKLLQAFQEIQNLRV
jgi:flagellar hook-basal body complex protein FliE